MYISFNTYREYRFRSVFSPSFSELVKKFTLMVDPHYVLPEGQNSEFKRLILMNLFSWSDEVRRGKFLMSFSPKGKWLKRVKLKRGGRRVRGLLGSGIGLWRRGREGRGWSPVRAGAGVNRTSEKT